MAINAILGPPGTGKTYTLLNIVKDRMANGMDPQRIGFVSFSKKATEEARNRAASELGLNYKLMVHFRTLHSMAFRQLNMKVESVIRGSDFDRLEQLLGTEFVSSRSMSINDGEFFRMGGAGDMYLAIYNMARVRGVPLLQQFHESHNFNLRENELLHIVNAYEDYKEELQKVDFVDMVQSFVEVGVAPELDLLIVDEAQDLVPLQWDMVDKLVESSKDVYYAGDDDQAIYEWMGVDPQGFLERCQTADHTTILDQSFRVPRAVHQVATSITDRIQTRIPKEYKPRDEDGCVSYHFGIDELPLETGQWLVLCRTNYIANKVSKTMKGMGYLFYRAGSGWSVSQKTLDNARLWTRLVQGKQITKAELSDLWKMIKVTKGERRAGNKLFNGEDLLDSMPDMVGVEWLEKLVPPSPDRPWRDDLRSSKWYHALNISDEERVYITSVLESGERFNDDNPRIVLSTIHKSKGGEADNVALLLTSSKACMTLGSEDSEKRVYYVGATRAKERLYVIEPATKGWSFSL